MGQASVIVVGNEKGGAGKSTLAIHIVTALLHGGAKVAVLDLDLRQQTMGHFFANRAAWLAANGATAPMPIEHAISSAGDTGLSCHLRKVRAPRKIVSSAASAIA